MLGNILCQNVSIIFSYCLWYMYYNIFCIEHVCICIPIWFLHLWTLPSVLTNSNVGQTLLNGLIKRMGSVYLQLWCQMLFIVLVVFEEDYSVLEKFKTRWICNRSGSNFRKYSLPYNFSLDRFIINLRLYLPSRWLIKFRIHVRSDWQIFVFNFKN